MTGGPPQRRTTECPSELVLDRYRLGELEGAEHARLHAHFDGCEPCQQRLARQAQETTDFAADFNIAQLAAEAQQRAEAAPTRDSWWQRLLHPRTLAPLVAAGVAALLAVLFWPHPVDDNGLDPGNGIRLKGTFSLGLRVQRAARQWTPTEGEPLQPGDRIRFVFNSARAGYLYIVGIDAAWKVTRYEPYGAAPPRRVASGQRQEVPGAIELDATLGQERLIALLCAKRIDPREVDQAAKAAVKADQRPAAPAKLTRLPLPCAQSARLLDKQNPASR